jgi:tetratricopeptide (TPR) repeat protein
MAKKPPARSASLNDLGMFALMFGVILLAYVPALHGGWLWDDDVHVTKPGLRSIAGLGAIWFHFGATPQYYPLLHSAFWVEYQLWGDSVVGYHLTNMVLHAAAAFLVVLIMRRLELPGAWLAGFLFAVHPVYVESIAWISEQKNTLSTVFYLASALTYLHFDQTRRRSQYFLALGLFALAILSKTVTATLPAAILVILWWQRGRLDSRRDVLPLTPWLALGGAAGLMSAWMERKVVGAEGAQFAMSLAQHILLAGRVMWFYLAKMLWPVNLMFIYPRWTVDTGAAWQYLFPLGVLALGAALFVMARRTRGPLAAFLFFIGTLVPVLGFLNVYPFIFSYVADHFQYVASLGIVVPAAVGLTLAGRRTTTLLPAAVVAVLAVLTWMQSSAYRDAETLYRQTVERNPEGWMAHNNLGGALMRMPGRSAEAIVQLQEALRLDPDLAEAHNNLGLLYSGMPGKTDDAVAEFRAALRLRPNYAEAHNNLGSTLSDLPGHLPEAMAEYEAALRIDPAYADAHNNLGSALSEDPARTQEAIAQFEAALETSPDMPEAHANLGVALAKVPGQIPDAVSHLQTALRMRPDMQPVRQLLAKIRDAQKQK